MLRKRFLLRNIVILFILIITFTIYVGQLINMQVANSGTFRKAEKKTTVKEFTVTALRGEIFDRNGEPLVVNKSVYNLVILGSEFKRDTMYDSLLSLIDLVEKNGCTITADSLPVTEIKKDDGTFDYSYTMALSADENEKYKFNRFLEKNKLDVNKTADELMSFLIVKYKLQECPKEILRKIIGIYYDFDRLDILAGNVYTFSEDVNTIIITQAKENSFNLPGVDIRLSSKRVYTKPGVASHILGYLEKIAPTDLDEFIKRGYSGDALVGKSGVEKAFEEYLRGKDGKITKTYDENGNLIKEEYVKKEDEPIAGYNIYLTIDIKMQELAEKSLAQTIELIHAFAAKSSNPEIGGIDANAASVVVQSPYNGEILVLATYPTYDLVTMRKEYNNLMRDENKPLLNRATSGQYAPGSVFKISTALTGLSEGIITPDTLIEDKGIWTKYGTGAGVYQPRCWKYLYNPGATHSWLNVSKAIKDSCNYFFFELGERIDSQIGFEKMAEYSRHLGLGEYTGIEIGETKGVLASPQTKDPWVPGDVIQAAIGQSDNLFSPLQMSTMLSTVLNGGTRYSTHLLKSVNEFHTNNIILYKEAEVLDQIEIDNITLQTLKQGMNEVLETGSAASLFTNFPIKIGGKTGTAQKIYGKSDYATFVSFAPYENPEIAISVVVEHGAKGTYAGYVAKDIMEYYFGYRTFDQILNIPPKTPE